MSAFFQGQIIQERTMKPMWTHYPHLFRVDGELAIPVSKVSQEGACFDRGVYLDDSYFQPIDPLAASIAQANAEVQP